MSLFSNLFKGKETKKEPSLDPEETLNIVADKDPNPRIEYYFEIKDKLDGWTDNQKALLYRWIGKACDAGFADKEYRDSQVCLAFFAASLALDSRAERDPWIYFDIKYGFPASQANADMLHKHYPLPETLEEARNYKVEIISNK